MKAGVRRLLLLIAQQVLSYSLVQFMGSIIVPPMPETDLYHKLQQIQDQVAQHAQGQTEIAEMERLLLSELLGPGQALLQEFIEQKKGLFRGSCGNGF